MKILHIAPSLSSEWGGPPRVVLGIASALIEKGIDVSILTCAEKGIEKGIVVPGGINLRILDKGRFDRFWTAYSPGAIRVMRKEIENCDLVHIHELWHYLHYLGYKVAKEFRRPYGITVHDQLSPWDLKHKWFRKKFYSILVQKRILRGASFLHAITENEAENVRNYGIDNNTYVIPNGINPEDFRTPVISQLDFQEIRNKIVVLFLGRIHPKKGLDLLARSWLEVARDRDDIALIIAGPDTQGYLAKIREILKSRNVMDKVVFLGMVEKDKKNAILKRADIVVIPSYSEVRSLVALEAMISQKPIIISNKCHFPEVSKAEAGIIIEPNVESLVNALNKLLVNPKMRKKMGKNGEKLVLERYTWDKISEKIIEMYKYAIKK